MSTRRKPYEDTNVATTFTLAEWRAEAERRFGEGHKQWAFICPVCKYRTTIADWLAAGAKEGEVAFSCVGRHRNGRSAFGGKGPGPCDYAGGGLFKLNPITVIVEDGSARQVFAFADGEGGDA
jgi:hypothetical protein